MDRKTALIAFPMHGQHKLSNEGYRTRDGHFIEWFGRKLVGSGEVRVVSRPEPRALAPLRRYRATSVAANTAPVSSFVWKLPSLRDRQRWWVDSLPMYHRALPSVSAPVVTWNPFLSLSSAWPSIVESGQAVGFDLLDDWTIHYAFEGVNQEVDRAYRKLFDQATVVTANAEGTVELAKRYGRDDVVFLPNGCDPERFDHTSIAAGPMTVGYVGKIGKRLNLELIVAAAQALPDVSFVFAGPVLDQEYKRPMSDQPNITMLGDVHYDDVPALLRKFDIGWVPHRVGEGEVGGDVIKTYEYRAAGLPVLSTPVTGASSRGLDEVAVLSADEQIDWLGKKAKSGPRIARVVTTLPGEVRWEGKADFILSRLGIGELRA
ncbi:glycosyltransferase [Microbacterium pygmaeum]|uniref:Glycosyltransferase involved in cell wall bisynthesis n=1 Tax=Microbacterium pygmaeum TaxID=370764 RepID=A0A1G7TDH5_9MICO|nr:glycosyltransferase [Microbacterium pygmaeum]SDG33074.1 Glycosyltransferase involved in cell wall bisynthesis [Microbacterium pygmaeum]SDH63163.1 Glycosyltransferase involved in cell wall bisynthesis [Microbacterium pygmaeum]